MSIDPKRWLVLGYGSLYLDPLKVKESLEGTSNYLTDNIKILLNEKVIGNLASNHVVIGVPTTKSYSRTFNLPLAVEKSLKDAIEVEVDQYIPIPSQALYLDYEVINRNKKEITVLLSAIPRPIVDKCIEATKSAGLMPTMVEPSISAVGRVLAATEDGSLPTV
ncbi:MAG: pilus assembly protein PilM, partial [Polynucleobacter sp.]|nr:pilus assembly protein PilM [Polynucleobacter sp.]